MSTQRYIPEFKVGAVRQIVDRGYAVTEVSERLGVSAHSLYKWVKAVKPDRSDQQAADLVEAINGPTANATNYSSALMPHSGGMVPHAGIGRGQ